MRGLNYHDFIRHLRVDETLDYFVPKEEIIKQGLMDKFERNYLDKQDALDKTAVALTQKGIDVICAKNLH